MAVMARVGRATLYMAGLAVMLVFLIVVGGLGVVGGKKADLAIGILFVFLTLVNMTTTGPVCYPIVAETPSGRLRYKTITIGRFVYNLTGIFSNSLTPRMVNTTGSLVVHPMRYVLMISVGMGSKNRLLLRGYQLVVSRLVLVPSPRNQGRSRLFPTTLPPFTEDSLFAMF